MPKEDLLREVWGADQFVTRNVVEVYIGYLRRKLTAVGAGHLVRTVRGHGYQVSDEPEPDDRADELPGGARGRGGSR